MTELGIVGAAPVVQLSSSGTVSRLGSPQLLDWWVGADDRWHIASVEPAIRQTIADDDQTVETRLKIPGGDAVQRVVCVPSGGTSVAIVEIQNDTPVPVSLALALAVAPGEIAIDGDTVTVDGRPVLRASRSVARALVADDAETALRQVDGGEALPPAEVVYPVRGAVAVVIFPLPHTAVFRCVLAMEPQDTLASPDQLPPVDAVARGWARHLEGGAKVLVPDNRVMQVVRSARRHLLIGSGQRPESAFWNQDCAAWAPAVGAAALGAWGHVSEGRELLLLASGPDDLSVHANRGTAEAGALLWAWAEHLERHRDSELEAAVHPWIEEVAIGLVRRSGRRARRHDAPGDAAWRAVGLASASAVISRLGNRVLGADVVDALPKLVGEIDPASQPLALALGGNRLGAPGAVSLLDILGAADGPNRFVSVVEAADLLGNLGRGGRTQHPEVSALWLHAVRRAMVDEPDGTGGPIQLLGALDQSWWGGSIEAHDVPVTGGAASFGVRWHAERPALLWDVQVGGGSPSVSAPGLDPEWSDSKAKGEALLAARPGIVEEAGPESAKVRKGKTVDIEDDPQSFG